MIKGNSNVYQLVSFLLKITLEKLGFRAYKLTRAFGEHKTQQNYEKL